MIKFFTFFFQFIWRLIIKYRLFKKKEHLIRYKERFGITNKKNNSNLETIWIHAVSVGEMNSAEILIKELSKKYFVVLTTTSLTSAKLAENFKFDNFIHQFNPVDWPLFVKKFLKNWKVKKAIFIESEFWPFTIYYTSKVAKIYLINARFSQTSYNIWYIFKHLFFRGVLKKYEEIFPSGDFSRNKFLSFDIHNIKNNINTKIFSKDDFNQKAKNQKNHFPFLQEKIKGKNVFSFISVHFSEMQTLKPLINRILIENENNIIIFLPRKLFETNKIENFVTQEFSSSRPIIINNEKQEVETSKIFILNQMGVVPFLYGITDIAFVCGSFVPNIGGHNPLEGIFLYKKCYFGIFYHKCIDLIEELKKHSLVNITDSSEFLKICLKKQTDDESLNFKTRVDNFFEEKKLILENFLQKF